MNKNIALVLCPPFWPSLPPLSLLSLGSFLIAHGFREHLYIRDLNNIFFNRADDALKKEWRKSSNRAWEEALPRILKRRFPGPLGNSW